MDRPDKGVRRARLVSALAVACLMVPACGPAGPEIAAVSGKVSHKGKPLNKGNVSFVPIAPDRPPASGTIGPDGSYSLQTAEGGRGAQLGEYKVAISGVDPNTPNEDIPGMPIKIKSDVPAKFANPDTSGLKATVVSGSNTKDFDLQD